MKVRLGGRMALVAAVFCGLIFALAPAHAQFAGPAVSAPSAGVATPASALNAQYSDVKIRPGDIIAIATYGAPELSTVGTTSVDATTGTGGGSANGIKVGAQGEIVLPYLGAVNVAGLTPPQAALFSRKN